MSRNEFHSPIYFSSKALEQKQNVYIFLLLFVSCFKTCSSLIIEIVMRIAPCIVHFSHAASHFLISATCRVKLKVGQLTSNKHQYALNYYGLALCEPREGVKMENENLGELVHGGRLENSPYRIQMKKDVYCEQVCISHVGRKESRRISPNKVVRAIRKRYQHNWIVDNLASISEMKYSKQGATKHFLGFPLGFVYQKKAYINNHVNIHLEYHLVDDPASNLEEYRIVKFIVEPLSIGHAFKHTSITDDDAEIHKKLNAHGRMAEIKNPIPSCDYSLSESLRRHAHTNLEMVNNGPGLQVASRHILFTYDVIWKENKEMSWTSRWDLYLDLNDAETNGEVAHWISISNSFMIAIFISVVIVWVLVHNLQQDYDRYCRPSLDEELLEDQQLESENFGWNQLCADVFRPPAHPLELAVFCGTGVQLLGMFFLTVLFAVFGTFSPDEREALIMALILLYVIMGGVSGYVMGRLYKAVNGQDWRKATVTMSLGFPSLVFITTCSMNMLAIRQSHESLPFASLAYFLVLWLGVSTPLVFLGSHYGYQADSIEFPVNTIMIPRQIPRQPWYMNSILTTSIGSIVPFGACFFEVSVLMSSLWIDEYYYVFGFLFLTLLCLLTICAEMTILLNYFQLCSEDYRWWWRSFMTSGFSAVYIFIYSLYYSTKLESKNPVSYLFYFGYMLLASFGISLMMGTVGVMSSLWFNLKIYKAYVSKSLKLS
jgi:transmembrane 9 superfamily protein 2/4